jgi:peptidoglycan/LPS O-acetylase OafA/YrhL
MNYQQSMSEAITRLRFPLIFFVMMLHSYSVVHLEGMHPVYFGSVYPFALWLGETGVPGFLFISGYLFFLSMKTYAEKLRARFHSLFIPYMLWNALLLIAYLTAYALGHPQDINGRSMADYGMMDYMRLFWDRGSFDNGNFVPLLCPYWYIRNLLLLSVLSPAIWLFTKYLRELFLLAVAVWWLMTPHNAFVAQSILFFSLGAWFSIHQVNPLQLFCRHKIFFLTLFIILGMADIAAHTLYPTPVNLQIHRLALIANLPALFLYYGGKRKEEGGRSFLSNSAFIVFSIHYPLMVVLRKVCIQYLGHCNDGIQVLLYWGCLIIVTLISLMFYLGLNRYFPRLTKILSGSRS